MQDLKFQLFAVEKQIKLLKTPMYVMVIPTSSKLPQQQQMKPFCGLRQIWQIEFSLKTICSRLIELVYCHVLMLQENLTLFSLCCFVGQVGGHQKRAKFVCCCRAPSILINKLTYFFYLPGHPQFKLRMFFCALSSHSTQI